jgi:hypothetical protein
MTTSGNNHTKNPKSRKIMQLMDKRIENITLCWVPGHAGITGNEEADEEAKRALEESIPNDEKYPPEDLSWRISTEIAVSPQRRWKEGKNAMKGKKKEHGLAKWHWEAEKARNWKLLTVKPHSVTKWKEPRTQTTRFAAQNSHYNTSYGSAKKQRKTAERVMWQKKKK